MIIQSVQQHMLMVATKHFDVRHLHNHLENFHPIGIPIYDIAEYVQCVCIFELNLPQYRFEPRHMSMYVGQYDDEGDADEEESEVDDEE